MKTTRKERQNIIRKNVRASFEIIGIALIPLAYGIALLLTSCVTLELELKPGKKKDAQCEAVCHPHKSTRSGDVCFCLPKNAEAYKP